jgi:hypothetical protein
MAKKPPISPQKIQLKNVKKRVKILKKPTLPPCECVTPTKYFFIWPNICGINTNHNNKLLNSYSSLNERELHQMKENVLN